MELVRPMYKAHPYFPLNKFGQKNGHYTRQNAVPTLNDAFCYCFCFQYRLRWVLKF